MPKPVKSLVSLDTTPFTIVFLFVYVTPLCDQDTLTDQNFNHQQRTEEAALTVDIEGGYGDFFVPVN